MHSLNLVYTFRAVPLIELCNGMTIGNVLLCVCTQAVYFYTSEGRAQCFAFEGNNKSQRCVCVCAFMHVGSLLWPIKRAAPLGFS